MEINKDMMDDSGRDSFAFFLLDNSSYDDPWREEIADRIAESTPDEIELIIEDLYMNQIDRWTAFRLKDINRRLDRCL